MKPIIISQLFDCGITEVWNALSNEDALKTWYFPVQNYTFEVGKTFSFYESDYSQNFLHKCEFLRIEPMKIIEHTWAYPHYSKGVSVLKWEISQEGNKTKVQITHSGTENLADAGHDFKRSNFEKGWNAILKTQLRNYLYGIKKLVFEVNIKASREKVWEKLWDKESYTLWTKPFTEGSYYEGELKEGNRVHLLSPTGEGMYSDIEILQENELLIFKHIGMLKDKKELPLDEETKTWTGCFESYRLKQNDGSTLVIVEVDTIENYVDWMNKSFPMALQELKKISEN